MIYLFPTTPSQTTNSKIGSPTEETVGIEISRIEENIQILRNLLGISLPEAGEKDAPTDLSHEIKGRLVRVTRYLSDMIDVISLLR